VKVPTFEVLSEPGLEAPLWSVHDWIAGPPAAGVQLKLVATVWPVFTVSPVAGELIDAVGGPAAGVVVVVVTGAVTVTEAWPLTLAVTVSAALIVCAPTVFRVALKVPVPFVSVVSAGNAADPSLELKWTLPA
jgi:hypothetical protein